MDILNDDEWIKGIASQRPVKPLRTSASQQEIMNLDVTTFSISEYMQGSALHAPETVAFEVAKSNILNEAASLLQDSKFGKSFGPATLAMLPLEILAQQSTGRDPETTANGDPNGTTTVSGGTNIPAELKQYGNGKIPAEILVPIGQGNHRLWEPAAIMFRNMVAAAAKDNVTISAGSTYRSYEEQVRVKRDKGNLAATPGKSNHGWGTAVDMSFGSNSNSPGYKWMVENAGKFGWVHPDWAKPNGSKPEPWHWEYRGSSKVGAGTTSVRW